MTLIQEAEPTCNDEVELPLVPGLERICEQCAQQFTPRSHSGGSPQRFCSSECRVAFHNTEGQRGQRSPACASVEPPLVPDSPPPKSPPAAFLKAPAFDWYNDNTVVIKEQPATAIYFNKDNALVIRQRDPLDEDDDPYIFIAEHNISEFLDRLCDICGVPSVGKRR
jgi:hypothetical protein